MPLGGTAHGAEHSAGWVIVQDALLPGKIEPVQLGVERVIPSGADHADLRSTRLLPDP
jgi:hypothetical protein